MFEEDYILKEKYRRLLNRLNQIKREMDTTNNVFKEIYNMAKDTVKIDSQCMESDSFAEIKQMGARNISSINSTISSIYNKI